MRTSNEALLDRFGTMRMTEAIQSEKSQIVFDEERTLNVGVPTLAPFSGVLLNKLLTSLEGEDFARLLPHMELVSVIAGQEVQACGDEPEYAYFPETAVLAHVFFMEDGSSTGAAIVGNDGMVGLSAILSNKQAPRWVHVIIGGTAVRIRMATIKEEFARGGAFQKLLFEYTNLRLMQLSQRAVCNGRHTLIQRLCTWLLMVKDRTAEEMPLTHEQIAMQLGARRAGITNACYTLKDCGIISYRRGRIRISDRSMLESAACQCYNVLKVAPAIRPLEI